VAGSVARLKNGVTQADWVCEVHGGMCNVDFATMEKRAKLIVAAPEMLAILEELQHSFIDIYSRACCPVCLDLKEDGHKPNCKLGNLLAKVRGK